MGGNVGKGFSFGWFLLRMYRALPGFRGKYRIGYILFRRCLERPEPVEVAAKKGLRFFLPNSVENIGKEIIIKGEYEIESVKAMVNALKAIKEPVCFDIGANIGALAIPLKKKLPSLDLHAFEASPATFTYLKKNFAANGLATDQVHNRLIFSADDQTLSFFDSAAFYGKSSLAPTYTQQAVTVRSTTIDEYCRVQKINRIDLIKVDVQGFELDVFKGMKTCLADRKIGAIYFEFEDWAEKAAGFRPGEAQEYLLAQGYQLLTEKGEWLDEPVRKGSVMLWARPGKMGNDFMPMQQLNKK